jgi:hypothetical protein
MANTSTDASDTGVTNPSMIMLEIDIFSMVVEAARARRYNRDAYGFDLDQLDPAWKVGVLPMFEHFHRHGDPCAPHRRCMVLCRLKGADETTTFDLDIDEALMRVLEDSWARVHAAL